MTEGQDAWVSIIYDRLHDAIFLLGVEGVPGRESEICFRFKTVNQSFLTLTGLVPEQLVGKRVDEVLPEGSRALALGKYKDAIRPRVPVSWEEVTAFPAGKRIGHVTALPIFDALSGACTNVLGTVPTSRSSVKPRTCCAKRRRWKRSGGWLAESRTTSTIS